MKLACLLLLVFFIDKANAQQVSSMVFDMATKLPVANAAVITKTGAAFTSPTGSFSINYNVKGDTIRVTHRGYKPYKLTATTFVPMVIYLQPDNIMLNEVSIKGLHDFKKDSLSTRREFAKTFAYKAPGIMDIFVARSPYERTNKPNNTSEIATINVLQLISLIGNHTSPQTKLQKILLKDEQDNYVSRRFSKDKVTEITGLRGDQLETFMFNYRPEPDEMKKMNEYDLVAYIKKCYKAMIKGGVK